MTQIRVLFCKKKIVSNLELKKRKQLFVVLEFLKIPKFKVEFGNFLNFYGQTWFPEFNSKEVQKYHGQTLLKYFTFPSYDLSINSYEQDRSH